MATSGDFEMAIDTRIKGLPIGESSALVAGRVLADSARLRRPTWDEGRDHRATGGDVPRLRLRRRIDAVPSRRGRR